MHDIIVRTKSGAAKWEAKIFSIDVKRVKRLDFILKSYKKCAVVLMFDFWFKIL